MIASQQQHRPGRGLLPLLVGMALLALALPAQAQSAGEDRKLFWGLEGPAAINSGGRYTVKGIGGYHLYLGGIDFGGGTALGLDLHSYSGDLNPPPGFTGTAPFTASMQGFLFRIPMDDALVFQFGLGGVDFNFPEHTESSLFNTYTVKSNGGGGGGSYQYLALSYRAENIVGSLSYNYTYLKKDVGLYNFGVYMGQEKRDYELGILSVGLGVWF
ncbi:MAG: hypothetical protein OEV94_01740 [Deltaproteobacteria bacterium]|nr:hypothetical protein [Deltaproteobacteria bacterium]